MATSDYSGRLDRIPRIAVEIASRTGGIGVTGGLSLLDTEIEGMSGGLQIAGGMLDGR